MANYVELQNQLIKDYKIIHEPDSKCWKRTHVHVKQRRICKHHIKESYQALFILLHEIGHIMTDRPGMKRAESESEAIIWQVAKMREFGFKIKQKELKKYKDYVRMTYDRGVRRGLSKRIKSKLYM